jgi:hypothetical protein
MLIRFRLLIIHCLPTRGAYFKKLLAAISFSAVCCFTPWCKPRDRRVLSTVVYLHTPPAQVLFVKPEVYILLHTTQSTRCVLARIFEHWMIRHLSGRTDEGVSLTTTYMKLTNSKTSKSFYRRAPFLKLFKLCAVSEANRDE